MKPGCARCGRGRARRVLCRSALAGDQDGRVGQRHAPDGSSTRSIPRLSPMSVWRAGYWRQRQPGDLWWSYLVLHRALDRGEQHVMSIGFVTKPCRRASPRSQTRFTASGDDHDGRPGNLIQSQPSMSSADEIRQQSIEACARSRQHLVSAQDEARVVPAEPAVTKLGSVGSSSRRGSSLVCAVPMVVLWRAASFDVRGGPRCCSPRPGPPDEQVCQRDELTRRRVRGRARAHERRRRARRTPAVARRPTPFERQLAAPGLRRGLLLASGSGCRVGSRRYETWGQTFRVRHRADPLEPVASRPRPAHEADPLAMPVVRLPARCQASSWSAPR
jgi:hypothetical protein